MPTVAGRTCVFAGATGQIGRGAVKALAEGGMNVVMVTHNPQSAQSIVEEFSSLPGRVVAMSNEGGDGSVFGEVEKEFGSVDVVINTIGGLDAPVPFEKIQPQVLSDKLEHQVVLPFVMMQAALPYLRKSRVPRMILAATAGAQDGFAGENLADSISRGAVLTATYALARELAKEGITVNCIARSGMVDDHPPRDEKDFSVQSIQGQIPLGRIGTAEDFGALGAYIASEESGFVTGQVFGLSGGLHIG